ncbi:hypothetical protein D3C72_1822700 [compost metagenome]
MLAGKAPVTVPGPVQEMTGPAPLCQPLLHSTVPLGASRGMLRVAGRAMVFCAAV